ncbi:unnamed protein product [Staurois parvus]|uniref:Uncharacterized protein n=1 Tax=Staurois parvus TaxID=386267 RepID=A0ABN9EEF5_9NEOB|nr:unnamed protein product [Staurois parvus]
MSLLTFFNFRFRPLYVPYIPTHTRNGTRKTDASIGWRRWPGTLQGDIAGAKDKVSAGGNP